MTSMLSLNQFLVDVAVLKEINMADAECPYCHGRGMKFFEMEHQTEESKEHPQTSDASVLCICSLNKFVSDKYEYLKAIPSVTGQDCIEVGKKLNLTDNYKFFGDQSKFLYLVKSFFILHYHYSRRFVVLTGADVAEQYAMAQEDGIIPTVRLLNDYDVVVLLCVSQINNKAITPGCYELIQNRQRLKRPVWLYASTESALRDSKEFSNKDFSETLEPLLQTYKVVTHDTAFKCPGYSESSSAQMSNRRKQDLHANLANI